VLTAKVFALTAYRLLRDGGIAAQALMNSYTPDFTRQSYVQYMESMLSTERMEITPVPQF
jgi:hypothetical protein